MLQMTSNKEYFHQPDGDWLERIASQPSCRNLCALLLPDGQSYAAALYKIGLRPLLTTPADSLSFSFSEHWTWLLPCARILRRDLGCEEGVQLVGTSYGSNGALRAQTETSPLNQKQIKDADATAKCSLNL